MPKVTIHNRRGVAVIWGSHRFPARSEKVVELDEVRLSRIRQKRGLRVVAVHDEESPASLDCPAEGCERTYKSASALAKHVAKEHPSDEATNEAGDESSAGDQEED